MMATNEKIEKKIFDLLLQSGFNSVDMSNGIAMVFFNAGVSGLVGKTFPSLRDRHLFIHFTEEDIE